MYIKRSLPTWLFTESPLCLIKEGVCFTKLLRSPSSDLKPNATSKYFHRDTNLKYLNFQTSTQGWGVSMVSLLYLSWCVPPTPPYCPTERVSHHRVEHFLNVLMNTNNSPYYWINSITYITFSVWLDWMNHVDKVNDIWFENLMYISTLNTWQQFS